MARGIVASRSQGLLIDLCAAVREERSGEKLLLLLHLKGLQSTFALPSQSAEADMVASRMAKRTSMEERKVSLQAAACRCCRTDGRRLPEEGPGCWGVFPSANSGERKDARLLA